MFNTNSAKCHCFRWSSILTTSTSSGRLLASGSRRWKETFERIFKKVISVKYLKDGRKLLAVFSLRPVGTGQGGPGQGEEGGSGGAHRRRVLQDHDILLQLHPEPWRTAQVEAAGSWRLQRYLRSNLSCSRWLPAPQFSSRGSMQWTLSTVSTLFSLLQLVSFCRARCVIDANPFHLDNVFIFMSRLKSLVLSPTRGWSTPARPSSRTSSTMPSPPPLTSPTVPTQSSSASSTSSRTWTAAW